MKKQNAPTPRRAPGWPEGRDDMINKFGTYEVQTTCGLEHPMPQIAQGRAESPRREALVERAREKSRRGTS